MSALYLVNFERVIPVMPDVISWRTVSNLHRYLRIIEAGERIHKTLRHGMPRSVCICRGYLTARRASTLKSANGRSLDEVLKIVNNLAL